MPWLRRSGAAPAQRALLAAWLGLIAATASNADDRHVPADGRAAGAVVADTAGAHARSADADTNAPVLDTVLVTGSQPGPGLWQVVKGDHRMWVVATLTPIPKDVEWLPDEVRAKVAASQAVLTQPGVRLNTGIGMVRAAFLAPSFLKARRNPDDGTLEQVLPAELYARWADMKQRYLPRKRRIERWRPIAAANELREAAAKAAGLVYRDPVTPVVLDTAEAAKVPVVSATVTIDIDVDKPRQRLKQLARTSLDDHACFAQVLDAIDTDVRQQGELANAWAIGDLDTLRTLTRVDPAVTCLRAALDNAVFDDFDIDFDTMRDRARTHWLAEAERLLAEHGTSFAVLSLPQVMASDGMLAALAQRDYTVIAPDDTGDEATGPDDSRRDRDPYRGNGEGHVEADLTGQDQAPRAHAELAAVDVAEHAHGAIVAG